MSSFLSQLPYIMAAALVIAGLAAVWAFASLHNEKERKRTSAAAKNAACSGCSMAGICMSSKSGGSGEKSADEEALLKCGKSGQSQNTFRRDEV